MLRALLAFVIVLIVGAVIWQELRYLEARRDLVHDLQPLLYSGDTFHVLTLLHHADEGESGATDDRPLLAAMRELRAASEAGEEAQVVYAGKVVVNALASTQLADRFDGDVPWSAVLLTQYDSRAAADRIMSSSPYLEALSHFDHVYASGMQRSPWVNLGIPLVLLGKRAVQIITGEPSHFPFVPAESTPGMLEAARRLSAAREYGEHAVVVANLLRTGTSANMDADREYTRRMFGMMAEGAHGPMHVGDAVPIEAGDRFDRVALVYYPGVDFFAGMLSSRFYQGIVIDKQLDDTQASITVPVLDRL